MKLEKGRVLRVYEQAQLAGYFTRATSCYKLAEITLREHYFYAPIACRRKGESRSSIGGLLHCWRPAT